MNRIERIIIHSGDRYSLTVRLKSLTRVAGGSVSLAIYTDAGSLLLSKTVPAVTDGIDLAVIDLDSAETATLRAGRHWLGVRYWFAGEDPQAITLAYQVQCEVRRGFPSDPGAIAAGGAGEQGAVVFVMPPDAPGMGRNIVSVELANADIPALTAEEVETIIAGLAAGLLFDAPANGSLYLRQDAAWVVLPPYPDVPVQEAPIDTTPYVRQDAAWLSLPPYPDVPVQEAPIDTTPYVRQDGAWLSLPMPSHNDLGGLNSGDFRHLTAAEYTKFQQPTDALGTLTTGDTITLDVAAYGATTATIPDAATITLAATGWPAAGFSEAHTLILTMQGSATVQIPVAWVPQGGDLTFDAAGSVTLVVYSPDGGTSIYYTGGQ